MGMRINRKGIVLPAGLSLRDICKHGGPGDYTVVEIDHEGNFSKVTMVTSNKLEALQFMEGREFGTVTLFRCGQFFATELEWWNWKKTDVRKEAQGGTARQNS